MYWHKYIVSWFGSITKLDECEPTKISKIIKVQNDIGVLKNAQTHWDLLQEDVTLIKLETQLSIEELIINSSPPTQCIKNLDLSIKRNKSLTLKEEKDALISTNWHGILFDAGRIFFRIFITIQKTCLQILFIDLTSPIINIATNTR